MKNILKTNIIVPSNIQLFFKNNLLFIQSSYGSTCLNFFFLKDLNISSKKKEHQYATFFRQFQKHILGLCLRFVIKLNLVGVGFRVESIENRLLQLKLGFSHLICVTIPFYINIYIQKKTTLILSSTNEQLLKEFCSKICFIKTPDLYKGKVSSINTKESF